MCKYSVGSGKIHQKWGYVNYVVNLLLSPSTALMIHIKGRAKIRFNQGRSSISGKQTFIDEYLLVASNIRLPIGQHTFQFESDLPSNCPPSFKGKHGCIKYQAIIVIPGFLWDKRIPSEFHILSHSPLPFFDSNVSLCELRKQYLQLASHSRFLWKSIYARWTPSPFQRVSLKLENIFW